MIVRIKTMISLHEDENNDTPIISEVVETDIEGGKWDVLNAISIQCESIKEKYRLFRRVIAQ